MKVVENQCTIKNPVDAPIVRSVHCFTISTLCYRVIVLAKSTSFG